MSFHLDRRTLTVGLFAAGAAPAVAAVPADPFPGAIRRAQAADATYREAGRLARDIRAAGAALPSGWRSYRADLLRARTLARFELHTLTPMTVDAAAALVAYYRDRAEICGDPAAVRAAQRRLRKVFRRPGAVLPISLPQARASPG